MPKYQGIPVSPGLAIGPARTYRPRKVEFDERRVESPAEEWHLVQRAIAAARAELAQLETRARELLGDHEAAIFEAHRLFLEDEELVSRLHFLVNEERLNAKAAVHRAFEQFAAALLELQDEYFRARAQDLQDVAQRLMHCVDGSSSADSLTDCTQPFVLLAEDLTPSDTIRFDRDLLLGLATVRGGPTSHSAILARALGIPAVVGVPISLDDVREHTLCVLNGTTGQINLGPTLHELETAQRERVEWQTQRQLELSRSALPAVLKGSSYPVEVAANIGSVEDAERAVAFGADGVGLLRTEFLYLHRASMPSISEQARVYRRIFEILGDRPVIVRTLDVGGDKEAPYLGTSKEPNPFLGWRAIRMIRERPDILRDQFAALLIAHSQAHKDADSIPLRIMLPMVSSVAEVQRARELLDEARQLLAAQGKSAPIQVKLGIMVEVPAAAILADRFAQVVDFFSIGTNDLTQYALAIDRTNERVAPLASPYHPAVLRLIEMTVKSAHEFGRWVGVCGELAGDPLAVPLLLGMGVDELSMVPSAIPTIKETIRHWSVDGCRAVAQQALSMSLAAEVIGLLSALKPA